MKINDHDNSPVEMFSRRNTVYNCTNRTLLELPTSGRDNCQRSWCRELADFRYRKVRHHRRPIASRINRQQDESRKRDISRYIVTTNFLQGDNVARQFFKIFNILMLLIIEYFLHFFKDFSTSELSKLQRNVLIQNYTVYFVGYAMSVAPGFFLLT